jgi:ADP-heptose:LPS heptosyltransferase
VASDSQPPTAEASRNPKLLVFEFWGLGDLTFATSIFTEAVRRYDVTLVGKDHALSLLHPTFPKIHFVAYNPPWTAYRHKYRFTEWNWRELLSLIAKLRTDKYDAAVSVRRDPRDHLLMWLSGAKARYGYPTKGSGLFLNHPVHASRAKRHRVEDWRDLGRALAFGGMETAEPHLQHARYHAERIDRLFQGIEIPVICLHAGARIATRRWPESHFAGIVEQMRANYDFHLILIPDPDGYGASLIPLADTVATGLALPEMINLLGRAHLLFCNDSGPAHVASACGCPVISIFGPADPDCFRPWGPKGHVIIRDICPWRPCFDYCKFSEPHCLTKLSAEIAWPEITAHLEALLDAGVVPLSLRKRNAVNARLA